MNIKTIQKRIETLKTMHAGDDVCAECLRVQAVGSGSIGPISECRKCIAATARFAVLMDEFEKAMSRNRAMANEIGG